MKSRVQNKMDSSIFNAHNKGHPIYFMACEFLLREGLFLLFCAHISKSHHMTRGNKGAQETKKEIEEEWKRRTPLLKPKINMMPP